MFSAGALCIGTSAFADTEALPSLCSDLSGPLPFPPQTLVFSRTRGALLGCITEDVLSEVYRRLDLPVRFVETPGLRSLQLSSMGHFAGETLRISGLTRKYPDLLQVDPPVAYMKSAAFVRRNSWVRIEKPDDLHRYTIAYLDGIVSAKRLGQYARKAMPMPTRAHALRALENGDVDAVIMGQISGQIASQRGGFRNISPEPVVLQTTSVHHYIHRKHAHLIPRVSAELAALKASGEANALFMSRAKELIHLGS
ncbi:Bacterial extracellular solute-binding proteins, family 3 [Tritonibacter multivorans]|uniref:Bacterial extracellular solute-binding proteins, family 3 n=1 Tax=Tritonibacter multivorans TaxID=928856 RepID=A0A0P1GJ20_9RHOB|nr:transporter substrate-binding domain-containing protein [Tritonibacter multivorans]CUH82077.1 Bacterial extracellular solute-binding proteins, family 3 [Tritonibacter multivorans]SFC93806.1 extracellular solute-binding protein, family 3 [Tritonibacter multivorans]